MSRVELEIGAPRYPVLNAFMRSRARASVIIGPLASGKTYGAVQRILEQSCEQKPNPEGVRPTRWLAIRNTFPDLSLTTIKDFNAVFENLGSMRYGGIEPPTFRAHFLLPDRTEVLAEVVFLALDHPDSVRKLRGTQITGIWLNEIKELPKAIVDMADLRHGRFPALVDGGVLPTWHGMLADCNAPDQDHWLYRLAEEQRPDGWEFYRQPGGVIRVGERWVPNPAAENAANLPEGYYVRGMAGKSDEWIRVFLGNEYGFVVDGKPVHPEYNDSAHCSPVELEADRRYGLVVGVDFGRTPAASITQYLEHAGRWVVLDEFTSEDMSASIFGPELKRFLDRRYPDFAVRAYGDPAGEGRGQATEDTPIQIIRAAGIPIAAAPSNAPALRRAAIANPCTRLCMDGRPAFIVSPRAKLTRKGLRGGFCYRRLRLSGEERFADVPEKGPLSHVVEACEYGLLGGGEGREALRMPEHMQRGPLQEVADGTGELRW